MLTEGSACKYASARVTGSLVTRMRRSGRPSRRAQAGWCTRRSREPGLPARGNWYPFSDKLVMTQADHEGTFRKLRILDQQTRNMPQRLLLGVLESPLTSFMDSCPFWRKGYTMLESVILKPCHKPTVKPGPGRAVDHLRLQVADLQLSFLCFRLFSGKAKSGYCNIT